LEEKDLPAGINLDGEPLSKSELRELEKLENVWDRNFLRKINKYY